MKACILMGAGALVALLGSPLLAEDALPRPNVRPGLWDYEAITKVTHPAPLPAEIERSTECLTEDSIRAENAFIDDAGMCETVRRAVSTDRMHIVMVCPAASGGTMTITTDLEFSWETVQGSVTILSTHGRSYMASEATMSGRRVGDC